MFQISVSDSRPSQPAIIVGGTPFLMTVKISPSVEPWSHCVVGQIGRLLSALLLDD